MKRGAFYPPEAHAGQTPTEDCAHAGIAGPGRPNLCSPVLELVLFAYPSRHDDRGPCCDASLQVTPATTQHDEPFINTVRGSGVDGMHEGNIPSSPSSFAAMLTKPLSPARISTMAPSRRAKTPTAVPRRSSRLAKKASSCTLAVAAAQNILMKKLGIMAGRALRRNTSRNTCVSSRKASQKAHIKMIGDLFMPDPSGPAQGLCP
jgi:hypothetical protein